MAVACHFAKVALVKRVRRLRFGIIPFVVAWSLAGCLSPTDSPQYDNASLVALGLPETPQGYASFTAMNEQLKPAGVNGRQVSISGSIRSKDGQTAYRIFLKPGYNCVTLGQSYVAGTIIKYDFCFDAIKSHEYSFRLKDNYYVVQDETAGRPVLHNGLTTTNTNGSALLVWSHLGHQPSDVGLIKGATFAGIFQGSDLVEARPEKTKKGEKTFNIKSGYHTFRIAYAWKNSLLSDPISVIQYVSLNVEPGDYIRLVSGNRGVSVLDARTNKILRDPK